MRLRRYLSNDVLGHTLAVSVVLLAIIITGRFVKYLAEAASGKLAAEILLPVMFYRMPGFLELLLPLGLFIGILMAYGRLYVESEMVVMSACGVGPGQMLRHTLTPALFITVLVAGLALFLTPQGAARSEALLNDPKALRGLQFLAAGRFQGQGSDGLVTFAAGIDQEEGQLRQVFAYEPADRDSAEVPRRGHITVAQRGQVLRSDENGARYLELQDGFRFTGAAGRNDFQITEFTRFGHRLPDDPTVVRSEPVDARTTASLLDSDTREDRAALHWRISLVVMVPVVAVLALSLSKTDHRRGRYIKLAPALLLHLCYLVLIVTTRTRIVEGEAEIAHYWAIHGTFALLALGLLFGPQNLQRLRHRS
ncbi:MAG: LPS export ABC transporter permease LptF [Pseudomonadota bacterium]